MTTEESRAVDEMLQDYKESREAMYTLTTRVNRLHREAESSSDAAAVGLLPENGFTAFAETLCLGQISLHNKIELLADSLKVMVSK